MRTLLPIFRWRTTKPFVAGIVVFIVTFVFLHRFRQNDYVLFEKAQLFINQTRTQTDSDLPFSRKFVIDRIESVDDMAEGKKKPPPKKIPQNQNGINWYLNEKGEVETIVTSLPTFTDYNTAQAPVNAKNRSEGVATPSKRQGLLTKGDIPAGKKTRENSNRDISVEVEESNDRRPKYFEFSEKQEGENSNTQQHLKSDTKDSIYNEHHFNNRGVKSAGVVNDSSSHDISFQQKNLMRTSTFKHASSVRSKNVSKAPSEESPSELPKSEMKRIKARFDERNKRISELCRIEQPGNSFLNNSYKGNGLKHDLANKRLHWCEVPKAGTTFVIYNLRKHFRFQPFHANQDRKPSFFIVREPYGRLISAYISKLVSHPKWWPTLGKFIVSNFRSGPSPGSSKCGHDATFSEFLKYFLHAQNTSKHKNRHFIPIHELCNPCSKPAFDFVAHLETMREDLTYIVDSVNVSTYDSFEFHSVPNIVGHFMDRPRSHGECGASWCPAFRRLWWGLQANGHILWEIPMPLSETECDTVTKSEMLQLALDAEARSKGKVDKKQQKLSAATQLYSQVSLKDRLKVKEALRLDFQFFGYDPEPDFVFPKYEPHGG